MSLPSPAVQLEELGNHIGIVHLEIHDHPAITPEQPATDCWRGLAAADTVVSADVLDAIDAIDAIDAPGVDLAAHEKYDTPPALLDAAHRRR